MANRVPEPFTYKGYAPGMTEDSEQEVILFVSADEETWLPSIVLAFHVTPKDAEVGQVKLDFTPEECLRIGGLFISMGTQVAEMKAELSPKPVEERKEILLLENQLLLDTSWPPQ